MARTHDIIDDETRCGRTIGKNEKPAKDGKIASCRRCKTLRKYGRR